MFKKKRGRSIQKIAEELKDIMDNCGVIDLTFFHKKQMSTDVKRSAEKYLKEHFDLWRKSWVDPIIAELREKTKGVRHDNK